MTDSIRPTIFQNGVTAYWGNVPRERNPWDETDNPTQRDLWFAGWDAGEAEVMEAPPTLPMSEVFALMGEPVG